MGAHVAPKKSFLKTASLAVGAALLATAGYAAGSRNASLRGIGYDGLVGDALLTVTDFNSYYNDLVKGVPCNEVIQTNNNIMQSTAIATGVNIPQQQNLQSWYTNNAGQTAVLAKAQETMQAAFDQCSALTSSTLPTPSSKKTAPTGSSISSYSEFGHLYSHETAGKPWPEIIRIDGLVRENYLAIGATVAVRNLNRWYHHHATAAERKDFDDNVVAHMKMGIPQ